MEGMELWGERMSAVWVVLGISWPICRQKDTLMAQRQRQMTTQ